MPNGKINRNIEWMQVDSGDVEGYLRRPGDPAYMPRILAQSAVPVIVLPSCTFADTTGAFNTLATAVPFDPTPLGVVQVFMYASAGIPAAGLYYARFSSATAGQLYTDALGIVKPSGLTAGAYAGGTAAGTLVSAVMPGGSMGPNGTLRISTVFSAAGAGGTKTQRYTLGGTLVDSFGAITSGSQIIHKQAHIHNRGLQSAQAASGSTSGNSSSYTLNAGTLIYTAIDTAQSQVVGIVGFMGAASDCLVLEQYLIEVFPG